MLIGLARPSATASTVSVGGSDAASGEATPPDGDAGADDEAGEPPVDAGEDGDRGGALADGGWLHAASTAVRIAASTAVSRGASARDADIGGIVIEATGRMPNAGRFG